MDRGVAGGGTLASVRVDRASLGKP